MPPRLLFSISVLLWLMGSPTRIWPQDQKAHSAAQYSCPATIGRKSPISPKDFFGASSANWNGDLYVGALWPNGTIIFRPGGPGHVYPDGSVGMKIAWYRANNLHGKLIIQGKRLDASGLPLRAITSDKSYGDTGFEPSTVIFPSGGCWQVTGIVGNAIVTFVTRVVKLRGLKVNDNISHAGYPKL